MSLVLINFYRFVALSDCDRWQQRLQNRCAALGLRGTILLAPEGINAGLVGDAEAIGQFLEELQQHPPFANLNLKTAVVTDWPFARLKVKVKPEIVTLGHPELNPAERTGILVAPQDWNHLLEDPEIVLIDVRNRFEIALGSFPQAVDPQTDRFRDFPTFVQEQLLPQQPAKVAMFCTGGIRCEKASAYLLEQGIETVYQLEGGILNYLEAIAPEDNRWQGDCFVFDERIAVDRQLQTPQHHLCEVCGQPVVAATCPCCQDAAQADSSPR
ncbi:rhodanese-like domain-containing protein [Synechococcus elongatus IITB4]|uniref:oxygen-dependent tRNA uridine(34) hydroxylase TrhO n=1 Tax=Synechococcus elongatus TaxID=32046 RepID=UPI0030D266B3